MTGQGIPLTSDFRERARVNDIPVARSLDLRQKEIADGRAPVMLAGGPRHANPMGTLHGGILCDIADPAMGMAYASTLALEESFTTVELKVNFLSPDLAGAEPSWSRTIGYVECNLTDEHSRLVAKAASACTVLRGQKAAES